MRRCRTWVSWLSLAALALVPPAGKAQPPRAGAAATPSRELASAPPAAAFGPARVPLDLLPREVRGRVRAVVEHPTLSSRGPSESFACRPETYAWLLDHHDRASRAWHRLGAECVPISDRGGGRFGWSDGQGSEVHWDLVYRDAASRVWYAEGRVRPGTLFPAVPVKAVVVLRFEEGRDRNGRPVVRHQADLALHTDSKAAALAARLMGASAPRLAEQYLGQMQMFFSALGWYLDQHPEEAPNLLAAAAFREE